MAKIDYKKGYTFRIGPLDHMQFARVDISINEIDTELDIPTQLKDASYTIEEIHKVIGEKVDAAIEEVLDANPEGEKK